MIVLCPIDFSRRIYIIRRKGLIMKIELIQETCCELCNDGIHVHMDTCPVCGEKYAGTDIWGNAYDNWEDDEIPSFKCEKCGEEFVASKKFGVIKKHEGIYYTDWKIVK